MAQIQPPETFDFSTPNEWPKWRKRFERYLVVSGMKKKEEADKIDLFMYLMGDRADDIFRTFKFEKEEEATKIDSVLKAFDSHFCVRKNIIYERAKFNSRIQEDREPVDEFITSLYKLADSCEFEGLHEQLIRDRIVVGVRDKALFERMQLDSELTLEKAVKMVRQQEAVRQQQVDLQRPSTSQKVNQVKFNSKKQSPKQQQQPSRKKEKSAKTRSRCPKCGGFTHREGQACRAEGQRCNLCSKTGHFANCCPDKQAKTAEVKAVSELDEEIGFLLEVSAVEDSSNLDDDEGECRRRWTAEIQVNGKKVKFKLDSQADVTCVPLCLFKKIMGQQRLVESDINLRAAEFSELQTVGMFISTLRNGNYEIKEKIYVIRRLSEPLLSRRACELLNLARRIEVVATRINPIKEFPEVFEGLGQIGNPYEIKLKPGAKPYAVHTPRRVPIPLMEKLKTRLEELEKAGIIAQVNVATEWCAPTVIAGKPNGDIRLCVDLSRLNEHVQREVHPMPVVEHMLGQLGEARFFSKLDANSGFHQIPLSPDCQHLTTFITPFGRYKYCRMPFGISLAPEYFQRVMSIILQGMDGVMCYLDDILIFASDSKTHDRILRLVLRKLKEAKVTLNKAKCVFGVPRINFLGHILDEDGIRPETVVSDNGTQFGAAREFANFARQYGFTHVTSSPRFPQSNGMAEAGVKIAKLILKKNQDPSLGLLEYRSTPLENGYSPAELLMGRKLRTTLPIAPENLNPKLVDSQTLKRKEGRRRKDMKSRYDRRCGATDMEELSEGDTVWITDMRTWGIVKQKASTPRSYMVDTPVETLRRNRFHLRKGVTVQYPADPSTPTFSEEELVENEKTPVVDYPSNDSEDGQIRTRSGRIVKPGDVLRTCKKTSTYVFPRDAAERDLASTGKALAATGEVWKIMEKSRLNSFGSSMKLLDSIILSTLLYSAPIWANEKYKILDQIQNNYLRRLLNLPSNTPGYILRMETGRFSLGVTATKLILKFWLRILKMEKSRLPAICLAQLWETSTLTNTFIGFTENLMNILNSTGFMWLKNCSDPNILQKAIPQIIRITIEQSIQTDQSRITNSKLHTHYKYLHKTFAAENYLLRELPLPTKRLIAQLRILFVLYREDHIKYLRTEDLKLKIEEDSDSSMSLELTLRGKILTLLDGLGGIRPHMQI
ncbi:hypothetical protein LAZ67_17000853 [Cordylochernes scorpioides]|uniref:Reverse transcriptase n=1 Tax=Cordylochernes scorpioides TaxID=51811 RepID=A0ABY6LDV7_9ARAC|nr:hypothetical protein LAZ67_17000853 [Cordylochernes scorpioides]